MAQQDKKSPSATKKASEKKASSSDSSAKKTTAKPKTASAKSGTTAKKTEAKKSAEKAPSKPRTAEKTAEAAKEKQKLEPRLAREVRGIIILFFGILYTYCAVSQSDAVIISFIGKTSLCLFGQIGRFLLEFSVMLHAVLILFDVKAFSERRGAYFIYILTLVLMILTTLNDPILQKYALNQAQLYSALWTATTNGGIIGGVLAKVFKSLLSVGGTYILLILLTLLSFVLIFRQSIAELIAKNALLAKQKGAELSMRFEERKEERREERLAAETTESAARLMKAELHYAPDESGAGSVPEVRYSSEFDPFLTPSHGEKPTEGRNEQKNEIDGEYLKNPFMKRGEAEKRTKNNDARNSDSRTLYDAGRNTEPTESKPIQREDSREQISFFGSVADEAEDAYADEAENARLDPIEAAVPDHSPLEPIVPNTPMLSEKLLNSTQKPIYVSSLLAPEAEDTTHKEVLSVKEAKPHVPYEFPPYSLLNTPSAQNSKAQKQEILATAAHLEQTLATFGIDAKVSAVSIGPTVTRFELKLQPGVRVSKVVNLSDDIAMALAAIQVRIEAPIPGKSAIGVEVPNREPSTVWLSAMLQTEEFKSSKSNLSVALGKLLSGDPLIMDIAKMPHLLIAGQTGSGKSVCINTIIMSILYHSSPEDVKMILVDPKMVELNVYNDIPHLLIPVVTDVKQASGALNWAVREMSGRYEALADNKVRDIGSYNKKMEAEGKEKMHHIIIIIDELNDLMMSGAQAVEASICRLAQLARAAGIHLVLATQRPSVNVITGLIKANIPSRISFAVASQIDSRTILDMGGAEKLLGKGDMLYYPTGYSQPVRAQCAFISDDEVERVVEFIKLKTEASYDNDVYEDIQSVKEDGSLPAEGGFDDELLPKAMEVAFEKMIISTSTIQRRLRLGYARAGRIIDEMEDRGFVTPAEGTKPRQVLVGRDEFAQIMRESSKE